MAYIGKQPLVGNFIKLDTITATATTTFNLLNGGVAYFPQSANNCLVSLNGILQAPTDSYTISGSTIIFSNALTTSDVIDFIIVLGDVLNIGTPSDNTVSTAKLVDASVTSAKVASGAVVQVVSATNNTNTTSSSSAYADTGLTASITPVSSSNKILVLVTHNGCGKSTNDTALQLKLLRGATDLIQFEKFAGATSSTAQNNFGTVAINYLDSPATTSSTTYKTQLSSFSNNATVYVNTGTIYSSITLMEIKA
jgi:hypothetical protein